MLWLRDAIYAGFRQRNVPAMLAYRMALRMLHWGFRTLPYPGEFDYYAKCAWRWEGR